MACSLGRGDGQIAHNSGKRLGAEQGMITCPECGEKVAVTGGSDGGWWTIQPHNQTIPDKKKITVLANGCFDGLHYGHVVHLQKARSLGDELIVSLTADEAVGKGSGRPVFPCHDRLEMLMALRCVDSVYVVHSAVEAIKLVMPQIFVKGMDWASKDIPEEALCKQLGIDMVFLDTKPVYSSTEILEGRMLERVRTSGQGSWQESSFLGGEDY